jgi:flavin-dependent thymidylate synthase
MKIINQPTVYVVGKQIVQPAELTRFLSDHGVSWESDSAVPAEVLTETAGRLCYMSFAKPRPGGNSAYLTHIKEVGHGSVLEHGVWNMVITGVSRSLCYLPGTEVLSEKGWIPVEQLKAGDVLLTKCPETGVCRWSTNKRLLTMSHDGPVHWFENSEWKSPGITPDHLVWAAQYDLRQCRDLSCREIANRFCKKVPFNQVEGKRLVVDHEIRTIGYDADIVRIGSELYDADLFFEWLGWCLTDGGASKNRKACYVTQTKAEGWGRITNLMDRLFPGRWSYCSSGVQNVARVHDSALWHYVCENFGRLKNVRRLTSLFKLSSRLIEKFLAGVIGGDGSVHKKSGHTVIYCNNDSMAGDLQVLLSMTGRSASVRVFAPAGREHYHCGLLVKSKQPEVLVSVHKETTSLVRADQQHKMWYRGLVHCPETDDGLVYVRREGHGVWSGNTHELVRHRAGWAYSQLSQRYVDESVAEYVEPDIIANDPDLHAVWLECVQNCHTAYVKLAEMLNKKLADPQAATAAMLPPDADRTTRRKTARQAARSVLPNATETKIFVTANARALRHFLEQRGGLGAEPEIRKLANVMLDVLATDSPNLFGDYQRLPLPDGTFEIKTRYPKV